MHPKEMQIVRFSLVVLFSSLMVVYLLLYQIKGDEIVKELSLVSSGTTITYQDNTGEDLYPEEDALLGSGEMFTEEEQSTGTRESSTDNSLFGSLTTGNQTTGTKTSITSKLFKNAMKVLSGTSLYYGSVESVEKIGLSYQYALKDQKGILYVYLGTGKYSTIDDSVRKLGGTTYKMTTEQELMQNKLIGEKVIYINLPEYKDKKVIMLIYIDGSVWLLQVDYATYHTSKGHIKKIFTE